MINDSLYRILNGHLPGLRFVFCGVAITTSILILNDRVQRPVLTGSGRQEDDLIATKTPQEVARHKWPFARRQSPNKDYALCGPFDAALFGVAEVGHRGEHGVARRAGQQAVAEVWQNYLVRSGFIGSSSFLILCK